MLVEIGYETAASFGVLCIPNVLVPILNPLYRLGDVNPNVLVPILNPLYCLGDVNPSVLVPILNPLVNNVYNETAEAEVNMAIFIFHSNDSDFR